MATERNIEEAREFFKGDRFATEGIKLIFGIIRLNKDINVCCAISRCQDD